MTEIDLSPDAVGAKIRSFVEDQFGGLDQTRVGLETELFREGIVDSMGVLTLLRFLEETYRIEIEPQEMRVEHFASINAMRDFVLAKKA
jgi:acyl carrier protein